MTTAEERSVLQTLKAFRKKRLEADWEKLDEPNAGTYDALWSELQELGATSLAWPAADGGITLSDRAKLDLMSELGAGVPALGAALIGHLTALTLLCEAVGERKLVQLPGFSDQSRVALIGSPLDTLPSTGFELSKAAGLRVSGSQWIALPACDFLVVPAQLDGRLRLLLLRRDTQGVVFSATRSSHGLCLIPFGQLSLDQVEVKPDEIFDWPASGLAAQQADGLITALITGMIREMAQRATSYAVVRYQGSKMIHQHDAVRQLLGPMHLAERALGPLAISTLGAQRAGDGGASAFAVELLRSCGLDAIQTFGGYGYMEDYRVERYMRDANTLETAWIHAAARQRAIAAQRCNDVL